MSEGRDEWDVVGEVRKLAEVVEFPIPGRRERVRALRAAGDRLNEVGDVVLVNGIGIWGNVRWEVDRSRQSYMQN
jgi:hypothetical protein